MNPYTDLVPLPGEVIAEAVYDPEEVTPSGIIASATWNERYPQIARVIATSSIRVSVGELILLEVESADVADTYYQVLEIILKDYGPIYCDAENEPVVKGTWADYQHRRGNSRITIEALGGQHFQFLASDIVSVQLGHQSSPAWKLMYPGVKMFWWYVGMKETLFYVIGAEKIFAILEEW